RLAAEYLGSVIKGKARVIVVGTKRDSYNHAQVVRGFFDQMNTTNPQIQIIELYESRMYPEEVFKTLQDFLSRFEDIKGIYANNARTTIRILEIAREQKQHRKLFVVGSELFDESSQALREGTLDAIIAQNASQQAYEGVSVAFRSLSGTEQITTKEIVPNALYLKNNLPLEQHAQSQSIIQMLDKEFLKDSEKTETKQTIPRKTT
ncbi:MAG: substrate-binding domain-containing protein, partial [Sphaerochaetaceae bacterium]